MPDIHLTPDQIFTFANYGVLPFWALLIFLPTLRLTDLVVHSVAAPLLLGALYLWLFVDGAFTEHGASLMDFTTLDGVMKLFTMKEAVVAGWVHYLVFDLFVGAWIGRDAQRCAVPHLVVVPCLLLTLLLGPLGLLAYLLLRGILNRGGWPLFEG
jgi:hypothetical protein